MDSVTCLVEDRGRGPEILIQVNGRPLQELARRAEQRHAADEGNATLAGSYAGLTPDDIHRSARHFLGEPRAVWFDDGDTVLMGCDCGEWGCWPLTAKIEAKGHTVRWNSFRNGHRTWDLSDLGPLEFPRSKYEAALDSLGIAE